MAVPDKERREDPDHEASMNANDESSIPRKLEALSREISAAYAQELKLLGNDNNDLFREKLLKSIRDLWETNQSSKAAVSHKAEFDPAFVKLDAIQAWKELVATMAEHNIFLDYVSLMEETFRELAEKQAPISEGEDTQQSARWFQHQCNLANLLTHTVNNHFRDDSTECRFVTILEVALSYQSIVTSNEGDENIVYRWKPSNDVQRFWVRLSQPIHPDTTPFDFRRRAYGVLVSLNWVPPAKGLLQACSIADRPGPMSPDTPHAVQQLLKKFLPRPLPRNDSVYQVLDRLKDETNVSVVISASKYNHVPSMGIGKTTVAALVASHPLILRAFQVLWLNMDHNKLSDTTPTDKLPYGLYIQYLDELCDQLGCPPREGGSQSSTNLLKRPAWPEVYSLLRIQEPAMREKREENFMRIAQHMMAELLEETRRNILLVLDNVVGDEELKWFHFVQRQSIVATSQAAVQEADFLVELDSWGEDESVQLFLMEAGFPEKHCISSSSELKDIVTHCHNHPVIVRTAARSFKMKQATSGLVQAIKEVHEALKQTQSHNVFVKDTPLTHTDNVPKALATLLDQALCPIVRRSRQPSILFQLCFASFAAVFSKYQPVPLMAVLLLWEQLFTMEPDALAECGDNLTSVQLRKRVWFIAEGLMHLGLISLVENEAGDACVSIHHDMYNTYALGLIAKLELGETPEETQMQWHKAFVAAYLTRKFEGNTVDSCHTYALRMLPRHMLHCKLYVQIIALLSNGRLFQERVAAFGRARATNLHVQDCLRLMEKVKHDPTVHDDPLRGIKKVAELSFQTDNDSEPTSSLGHAKNLYSIGFGLCENGKHSEAIELLELASRLVPRSHPFSATVLYGLGSLNMALNEPHKAIKSFMASITCMKILGEDGEEDGKARNPLFLEVMRLQGEASMAQCNYRMALTQFEDTVELMKDDSHESEIEYGVLIHRKGRLHQVMGDIELAASELEKCLKWKAKIGEISRNRAMAHSALADLYTDMGRTGDARKQTDAAISMFEQAKARWPKLEHGDDSDSELMLLTAKRRTLRPDLSEDLTIYESIRQKLVASPVLMMDQSGYDLRCIAKAYMSSNEQEKAVSVLEDALKIMSDRNDSLERALCLLELGNSFLDQGEGYSNESKARTLFELALDLFQLALNIQEPKLGDCQQVLETLDAIGNLHVHLKQYEKASKVYFDALALARKLRSGNEKIAGILYFLGECEEVSGHFETAEIWYQQCLECLRVERSPEDLDLIRPLERMGGIVSKQRKFETGREIYTEILRIQTVHLDSNDVQLGKTLLQLGKMKSGLQDYDSALEHLVKALDIIRDKQDWRLISDTLYEIGHSHRILGDFENAMKFLDESKSALEEMEDSECPEQAAKVLLAIGNTYLNIGNVVDAATFCRQALATRTSVFGQDHSSTAHAAKSLGMSYYFLNKTTDACYLLQEYVRIMEGRSDQLKSAEYVAVLVMLHDILQTMDGHQKLAKRILTTAKDLAAKMKRQVMNDGSSDVRLGVYSDLITMIDVRWSDSRVEDSLYHDPVETKVLQSIILSDG